ncbi:MAG: hypothetical protein HQK79_21780 [Desulfobacterales bacterium]|nr:hypothetical protein [Desulfobacterales bacterium]MBF0397686.1 hypothetical protein [Desulfobacterales bacterium]
MKLQNQGIQGNQSNQYNQGISHNLTIKKKVHFKNNINGRKTMQEGENLNKDVPSGRIPRISRLMALAIRLDTMVKNGEMRDLADIARLGHISRARMSQIADMLMLAPEIQEFLLFLPLIKKGNDCISEHEIRVISKELDCDKQRVIFRKMKLQDGIKKIVKHP